MLFLFIKFMKKKTLYKCYIACNTFLPLVSFFQDLEINPIYYQIKFSQKNTVSDLRYFNKSCTFQSRILIKQRKTLNNFQISFH